MSEQIANMPLSPMLKAPLAITPGEPAGVGPDICLSLAQQGLSEPCVFIASASLMRQRANTLGLDIEINIWDGHSAIDALPGQCWVYDQALVVPSQAGQLAKQNSDYVLKTLDIAVDGCLAGTFSAMVTAPVHKGVINDFGIPFQGHTEYLQARCGVPRVVMMLATTELRVALVTTHLPLRQVPDAITAASLSETIDITLHDLREKFAIAHPRVLVAGLNPHAGEGGHMGHEEITIMQPVLDAYRKSGVDLVGPLPADTLFTTHHLDHADAVIAMYHDQGLPVLKYQGFGRAINITLGLPIIRTSVDHGTALDLAGSGQADTGSLAAAIALAADIAQAQANQKPLAKEHVNHV